MRAAAVEVLPSSEEGSLLLHVYGREKDSMQATWEVTEIFLSPKVWIETRAELK